MAGMAYDDIERWVKGGFWGTSSEYWGKARISKSGQIDAARDIDRPGATNHTTIKTFYEAVLQRYLEINSKLVINALGSGRIEIQCAAIQSVSDMSRLSVEVKYDSPGWQIPYEFVSGLRKTFIRSGVAIVTVPAGSYDADGGEFVVEAEMRSMATGSLTAEKTLPEGAVWE